MVGRKVTLVTASERLKKKSSLYYIMAFLKHLRVTINEDSAKTYAEYIVKTYKPALYLFATEVGERGGQHMHAHLEFDKDVPKQTMSSFMNKNGFKGQYYFKAVKKTVEANLSYVGKEDNIILHNLSEDQFTELRSKIEEINEDKQKDIKLKLVEHFKKEGACDLNTMCEKIMNLYIDKYDKLPPPRHLIMAYSIYVSRKLNVNIQHIKDYSQSFF